VVQDAMDETSDRDTLAAIAAGTTTLQYINGRTTARDPLNHQDRAYLLGWFALEPDQLFRDLPTTVETAIQHSMLGVPYADEDTYFSQTRDAYLRPVADAMLNLTNPDVGGFPMTMGGTLSTQQMSHIPGYLESNFLTDVRTLEIGVPSQLQPEVAEQRGYPHPLAEQGAGPTAVYVLGPPSDHHDADTTLDHVDAWRDDPNVAIPNLERLEGFAHLVEASTVEGGDAFMSNLADHADLVEQQLNELPESHEESLATTFRGLLGEDGEYMGLSPDELGDHFASEDRLVAEIEDQLEPLMGRGNDAVATIRAVVERNSP
jgi:hypothetical protein